MIKTGYSQSLFKYLNTAMNVQKHFQYLALFGGISLIGLAIDVFIFNILVALSAHIFYASIFSSGCAIAFVFFTSADRLFDSVGDYLPQKFCMYLTYQIILILGVSAALAHIHASDIPLISHQFVLKFLPLPFTFTCNAIATFILLRK